MQAKRSNNGSARIPLSYLDSTNIHHLPTESRAGAKPLDVDMITQSLKYSSRWGRQTKTVKTYPQPEYGTQQVLNKWLSGDWLDAGLGDKMWRQDDELQICN